MASSQKLAHLLNPIRDLAENWSIDIAADLEHYLAELEAITVSLDGGATSVNFSQAALIIQGSTCVYSRKVEFLHKLVFQCLEVISERKASSKEKEARAASGDDSGDADIILANEPEFLPLDDIVEAKGIDLVDDEGEDAGDNSLVPRTSLLLMSMAGASGKSAPEGDFTLASARMHSSGAVMLQASERFFYSRRTHSTTGGSARGGGGGGGNSTNVAPTIARFGSTPEQAALATVGESTTGGAEASHTASLDDLNGSAIPLANGAGADSEFVFDGGMHDQFDDDDDDDNDVGDMDFGLCGDDGVALPPPPPSAMDADASETSDTTVPPAATARITRSACAAAAGRSATASAKIVTVAPPMKTRDLWKMLDPHQPEPDAVKEFKKGKTWVRPKSAEEEDGESGSSAAPFSSILSSLTSNKPILPEGCHLREPLFAESFASFISEKSRRRATAFAVHLANKSAILPPALALREAEEALEEEEANEPMYVGGMAGTGDGEDLVAEAGVEGGQAADGAAGGGGAADFMMDYGNDYGGGMDDDDDDDDDHGGFDGGMDGDLPYLLKDGAGVRPDHNLSQDSITYEDLCRQYIEKFMAGADQWAEETHLVKRVNEWQDRVQPLLQEERERPAFDIKQYEADIVKRVHVLVEVEPESVTSFAKLVEDKPRYDIARMFLATLMLASEGNLEIDFNRESGELKLGLNNSQLRTDIEEYEAPSIQSAKKKKQNVARIGKAASAVRRLDTIADKENMPNGDDLLSQKTTQPKSQSQRTRLGAVRA